MTIDREALKRKAIRAIDQASDDELRRARQDREYAHDWLQSLIGWIANLLNILTSIFGGCHITTAVVEHFGLDDDCGVLTDLRRFRDQFITNSGSADRLDDLERYYLLAPSVIRWVNCRVDSESLWVLLLYGVFAGHTAIQQGQYDYAYTVFREMGPNLQMNVIVRPQLLNDLLARQDICELSCKRAAAAVRRSLDRG